MATTIEQYIEDDRKQMIEANLADNRGTPGYQIENAASKHLLEFKSGLALMTTVGPADLARCLRLYNTRHDYRSHDLRRVCIRNVWVIVPAYVELIDEMLMLRKAIN